MRNPRNCLALMLVALATLAHAKIPATKPADKPPLVESRYDRIKDETLIGGVHPVICDNKNIIVVCISEVLFKGKNPTDPPKAISMMIAFRHLNANWSKTVPSCFFLIDGRVAIPVMPSEFVSDEGTGKEDQNLTVKLTTDVLKKIFAGKTVEMRIDTAEFSITPEGVGALREMAKLAGL